MTPLRKAEDEAPRSAYPSLTLAQVAELLHCDQSTIHRWLQRGEGPASYRIGGHRLFKEADVIAFIESLRCDGGVPVRRQRQRAGR